MTSMDEVLALLERVMSARMWGEVQIIFRDGKPTLTRTVETQRLDGGTADGKDPIRR